MKLFDNWKNALTDKGLNVETLDLERPWGGFFVINEIDSSLFIDTFFGEHDQKELLKSSKVSPKLLFVKPGQRLSWQYHHRRSEIWKVLEGPVGIARSTNDEQGSIQEFQVGNVIELACGERHRLIGLSEWGIIAEIWRHVDAENPSNEDDIVRVQDDYGRR